MYQKLNDAVYFKCKDIVVIKLSAHMTSLDCEKHIGDSSPVPRMILTIFLYL